MGVVGERIGLGDMMTDAVLALIAAAAVVGIGVLFLNGFDVQRLALLSSEQTQGAAIAYVAAVAALILVFRSKLVHAPTIERLKFAVFILTPPGVLAAYIVYYALDPAQRFNTARGAFALLATVFPPALFYLFLATRRLALLSSFLNDLYRMGLFDSRRARVDGIVAEERPEARLRRLTSYMERFQAAFGILPREQVQAIVDSGGDGRACLDKLEFRLPAGALVPLTLLTLACGVGWLLALPPVGTPPANVFALTPVPEPVIYAFLGAYFYGVQMLVWRYLGRDLTPDAYVGFLKRLLLASLGIWFVLNLPAMNDAANTSLLICLAFVTGVFPVVVWELMSSFAKKVPGLSVVLPSLQERLPLSLLEGVNLWHQSRLEDEDIDCIQNMATSDVVDLMINTRFTTLRLLDWVDQAILIHAVGAIGDDRGASLRAALVGQAIHNAGDLVHRVTAGDLPDIDVTVDGTATSLRQWAAGLAAPIESNPNYHLIRRWKAWGRQLSPSNG